VVTTPMVVAVAVAAPVLCVTIFGAEFADSVTQLRVLLIGSAGMIALKQLGGALTAQRRPLDASAGAAVTFAAIVALDVALIPSAGALGASVASAVAYSFGGAATAALFLRRLGGRPGELVPGRGDVGELIGLTRRTLVAVATRARPAPSGRSAL
jgi:O-antigen/teichoic acid export membrane protein